MEDDKKDLEDFLAGKESENGKKIYETWYHSVPDGVNSGIDLTQDDLKKELAKIKAGKTIPIHSRKESYAFYWKAAAVALIIISAGLFLFIKNFSAHSGNIVLVEQIVPRGKMIHLSMSDGTQVWLNSDSRFRYPRKFSAGNREVYLEGEAFFDVAKDPKRPFRIHSQDLTTTVLGTSFNLRSYGSEDMQEVAVISGKVSVIHSDTNTSQEIKLLPGEKAQLTKNSGELSKLMFVDYNRYTSWKDGKLIFENTPVSDVISSLERRYDIDIELGSKAMENCRVTAEFDRLPVERIMYLLCYTLKGKYSVTNSGYLIQGHGCK